MIAFNAPNLDASDATSDFLKPFIVHHVFDKAPLMVAVDRAVSESFLRHSDICVAAGGRVSMVINAPLKSRPNGLDIRCCNQPCKYIKAQQTSIRFRCQSPGHVGGRYITVIVDEKSHQIVTIERGNGRFRYIVKEITVE